MRLDRYGILPMLAFCSGLIFIGLWAMAWLVNNAWLVPTGNPAHEDMLRAVATGRTDAIELIQASDFGLIVLFLIAVGVVAFGLGLPFVYFLNRRIRTARALIPATTGVLLRQALWFGLWLSASVLLQMYRAFNWPVSLMILTVFALIEMLLIVRWKSAQTLPPPTFEP